MIHRSRPAQPTALTLVGLLLVLVLAACAPSAAAKAGSPAPQPAIETTTAGAAAPAPGSSTEPATPSRGVAVDPLDALDPALDAPVASASPLPAVPDPVVAAPTEAPAVTPGPTPAATAPPPVVLSAPPAALPPAEPFAMNLFTEGDFVPQYTFEWCVGASIQMTLNMVRPENDASYALQESLWIMARDRSSNPQRGANPVGWTQALNELGVGPYQLVSLPDHDSAVRAAASAMRATGRPVGLVMWAGRHAWVMNGFTSIGDPAIHSDFQVTGIHVLDPLYPHGSAVWGPSPVPNQLMTPAELSVQFVIRDATRRYIGVPPGWVLILPTAG